MKKVTLIPGYPHILHGGDYNPDQWLETPQIIDDDFRLMKLAGCNTFSVGIFAWSRLEPAENQFDFAWLDDIMDRMAAAGQKVFLATPSGAKPAWMAEKYPEIRKVGPDGLRDPQEARHNFCWTSPLYRQKVQQINSKLAERYANHPALGGWHISNEYAGSRHEGDCYCELCQEEFRTFLKRRYGSLENLNHAWYTAFWGVKPSTWSQVTPFVTADTRVLDWRRFTTEQCKSFICNEAAPLRQFTPDLPVTINMMGFYNQLNYQELASVVDFISDDVYPCWYDPESLGREAAASSMRHDLNRAMKQKPFLVMESSPSATNWQKFGRLLRPGTLKFQQLMALGHGADGTMYFQWRKGRGNLEKMHGAVIDHVGNEHTRVFHDVAELGKLYRNCDDLTGTSYPVETALLYDWEANWALQATQGPSQEKKQYHETALSHYQTFWNKNIPLDVISPHADFGRYKLLIVPMLFMLDQDVADRLKKFTAQGGTVVATYLTGYVNVNNAFHLGGLPGAGLQELFGIWNEEIDGMTSQDEQTVEYEAKSYSVCDYAELLHAKTASVIATYGKDFYADSPAVTCHEFGAGRAYYIAARTGGDFLSDFYESVLKQCVIEPVLNPNQQKIHATYRTDGNQKFLFIFNYDNRNQQTVELPDGEYVDKGNNSIISGKITLQPRESMILKKL